MRQSPDPAVTRRKLLQGAGVAALTGIAGCSTFGGGGESTPTVTPVEVPQVRRTTPPLPFTTLELRHEAVATDGPASAAMNALVATFEDRHETVDIQQVQPPSDQLARQMTRTVARDYALVDYGTPGQTLATRTTPEQRRDLSSIWGRPFSYSIPGGVTDSCYLNLSLVAVPLELHRIDCLFYNPEVLEPAGLDPHGLGTVEELAGLADDLAGVVDTPLVAPTSPLELLGLWESLLAGHVGSLGTLLQLLNGSIPENSSLLEQSLSDLDRYLAVAESTAAASPDAGGLDDVVSGSVGFVHRPSWAAQQLIARPDAAFEDNWAVASLPATDRPFVFSAQAFSVPAESNRREVVDTFLELTTRKEVQRRYNELRGSIPPRRDAAADLGGHQFYATQGQAYRWASATYPSMTYGLAVDAETRTLLGGILLAFAADRDVEATTERLQSLFAGD